MNHKTSIDFSQGSIWRHTLNQTLPLLLAQFVQLLYNIVDRVYLGHLEDIGEMALTGVGLIFPITTLIMAFTQMFGVGATPLFSIARGKQDQEEAEKVLGHSFTLLLGSGLILIFLCYVLKKPLLYAVGASDASYVYANQYLEIYILGTVFIMLTSGLNGFINAQGFPKTGMFTILIGAIMNIILDPIFIFAFHLNVRGAAIATVLSQMTACIWVIAFFCGKKTEYHIRFNSMKLEKALTARICSLGLAGFIMQGTNMATQVVCNRMLGLYGGDLYISIMTILNSIRDILSLPSLSLSEGSKPIMGYNYGAGNTERVKKSIQLMTIFGFIYLLLAWGLSLIFAKPLIGMFTNSSEILAKGLPVMRIYFFGFVFMAFQHGGQSTFTGLGIAKKAIFFSLFRKIIIVVPLTIILPNFYGINGVFLAEPISNVIGGLACFTTMYLTVYRRLDEIVGKNRKER